MVPCGQLVRGGPGEATMQIIRALCFLAVTILCGGLTAAGPSEAVVVREGAAATGLRQESIRGFDDPAARVEQVVGAVKRGDWRGAGRLHEPASLESLKAMMTSALDRALEAGFGDAALEALAVRSRDELAAAPAAELI